MFNNCCKKIRLFVGVALAAGAASPLLANADLLSKLKGNEFLASSVPFKGLASGDENPYSLVVSTVNAGKIHKGDVLFDNFNNSKNFQGTGTTIMQFDPKTQKTRVFARFDNTQDKCPGGIGLTTAMTILKSGYVVVGSMPSTDGTTKTLGQGCLLVTNSEGQWVKTIVDPKINGPWGRMAVSDQGDTAHLFISNIGFGLKGSSPKTILKKATVARVTLNVPDNAPPELVNITDVGSWFPARSSKGAFAIGPVGLALGKNGDLYVANELNNSINVIPDALTRSTSAGTGKVLTKDGFLKAPLGMLKTKDGNLVIANAQNGQLVEIDAKTGKQLGTYWADKDPAQQPPGSGDLFGIALNPEGNGIYFVRDDNNTLMEAVEK